MSEEVETYIKQVNVEGAVVFVFKCPICKKVIIARARTEAVDNGSKHLNHCRRLLEKLMGVAR